MKNKRMTFRREKIIRQNNCKKNELLSCRLLKRNHDILWSKYDYIFVLFIVLVYGAISMFRLGNASAPESYWKGANGQRVEIDFGDDKNIKQIWLFTGISDGSIELIPDAVNSANHEIAAVSTANNTITELSSVVLEAKHGVMFRWQAYNCDIATDKLMLECIGDCWINEMVFLDENDEEILPKQVTQVNLQGEISDDTNSDVLHIFDEQNLRPDRPSHLNGMYFDELYHGRTAYEHINNLQPYETTHPPLGKLLISVGIRIFGMNPFGWRIVGNVFGILMIPVFYALAKRLLKKRNLAIATTFLFTFDFMHYTQTRIATIDVFGVFFILAMYYFMLKYWQMNYYTDGLAKTLIPLGLAGISFGLGIACKWIDIYAGIGLAVLFFVSLFMRYEEYRLARTPTFKSRKKEYFNLTQPFAKNTIITLVFCLVFFVIIPIAIYTLSYIPYFNVDGKNTFTFSNFIESQKVMFGYHSQLNARHGFESSWWTWPLNIRPIFYYSGKGLADGFGEVISAFGNPVVWWVGLVALVVLIVRTFKRKRIDSISAFILIGFAAQFLPWTLVTRATFIYHYFASVPFIILATGFVFKLWSKKNKHADVVLYSITGVAILLFIFYFPAISGLPVSQGYLDALKFLPTWTW